jgi:muramoyltetrapeptide carboxypeptidase
MTAPFKKLHPGESIAIIAPAGWVDPTRLDACFAYIRESGFTFKVFEQVHKREGRFAGTDAERLDGLHSAYVDGEVKAIICVRGGYGCQRIIDGVNWDLIKRNPKPLIGYSDITALLNAIPVRTGQPGLLGPLLGDISRFDSHETWKHLRALLTGEPIKPTDHPACRAAKVFVPGEAKGRLVGGNLSLLATECGTPTQIDTTDAILVIEEVKEELYRFDRMLLQLKRAGLYKNLRGVIVGDLVGVDDTSPPLFGKSAHSLIREYFGELGIPVIADFPCGHGTHRTVLPLGLTATLKATEKAITISHPALFA